MESILNESGPSILAKRKVIGKAWTTRQGRHLALHVWPSKIPHTRGTANRNSSRAHRAHGLAQLGTIVGNSRDGAAVFACGAITTSITVRATPALGSSRISMTAILISLDKRQRRDLLGGDGVGATAAAKAILGP